MDFRLWTFLLAVDGGRFSLSGLSGRLVSLVYLVYFAVDYGLWTVDLRLWTFLLAVDCGPWTVD